MTEPTRVVDWHLSVEPYWRRVPGAVPLLHAIAENPDDDTTRLVLADLCDDVGECGRAEFIRLQVRPGERYPEPYTRQRELFDAEGGRWVEGLPVVAGVKWLDPSRFERGMLSRVVVDGPATDASLAAVFAAVEVRRLHLAKRPEVGRDLAVSLFDRLTSLHVFATHLDFADLLAILEALPSANLRELHAGLCEDTGPHLARLFAMPSLRNLVTLDLGYSQLDQESFAALGESDVLCELRHLNLEKCHIDDEAVALLAAWPGVEPLRSLNFHCNDVQDDGALALADSPYLTNLQELTLGENRLTDAGAIALANSAGLRNVARITVESNPIGLDGKFALAGRSGDDGSLDLWGADVGDEDVPRIAAFMDATAVTNLSLAGRFTAAGIAALAAHPAMRRLTSLTVGETACGLAGIGRLTTACPALTDLHVYDLPAMPDVFAAGSLPGLPDTLTSLTFAHRPFGDGLADYLARSDFPASLGTLNLGFSGLSFLGLQRLAGPTFAGLESLDLGGNFLGDIGASVLAACGELRSLKRLSLHATGVTDTGLRAILSSPDLSALTDLGASGNLLDADAVARIAAARRPSTLSRLSLSVTPDAVAGLDALRTAWAGVTVSAEVRERE